MRKSLVLLLTFIFLIVFTGKHSISQTTPRVIIDTVIADGLNYGDEINMPVMAYDLYNIGSIGIWLSFDTNTLNYVTINNINPKISTSCTYNYDGTYIKIGWYQMGSSGIDLNNTMLFNIKFTYKTYSTPISFYKKKCVFGDFTTLLPISVTYFDGMVLNSPAPFNLTLPFNNVYVSNTPYFQWTASSGAAYYQLYIDSELYKDNITGTSYYVTTGNALTNGNHTWHIVSCNKLGTIASQQTWNIIVGDAVAKGFSLISPANNSTTDDACNQLFTWHSYGDAMSSPSRYEFYLEGFEHFTLGPEDTSLVFPYTIPYGDNSWFVKVFDEYENEVVSQTNNFYLQENKIFSVDGYLTYNNSTNSPLRSINIYLRNNGNETIDSTITDNEGYFRFENLGNGKYKLLAMTDKEAGGIDITDALLISKFYVKLYNTDDTLKISSADVNANNKVNPEDAFTVNRYFTRLIESFSGGQWVFAKPVFIIDCYNTSVNFKGLCVGDFNASYRPED